MRKITVIYILSLVAFISCEKEVKLDFSGFEQNIVINGILNPDSIVNVNITYSERYDFSGDFKWVENAEVYLSENNKEGKKLVYSGNGDYKLNIYPASGQTYWLKVRVNGKIFTASTTVPNTPDLHVATEEWGSHKYQITLKSNDSNGNSYWVGSKYCERYSHFYRNDWVISWHCYTDFLFGDSFNREETESDEYSMPYYYNMYMRIENSIQKSYIDFQLEPFLLDADYDKIFVFKVDDHFDQYLKTAIIESMNKSHGDNMIFTTPINVHSNIDGGRGIFGSYSISIFNFNYSNNPD